MITSGLPLDQGTRAFLTKYKPFSKLPSEEIHRLAKFARIVEHPKGKHIFAEGEEALSVWILRSGRLEIQKYTSDGKPRSIETISPGELYGTLCRMGNSQAEYPCTAVAAVPSTSVRIPEHTFIELFKKYPSVVFSICTLCSQRLNQLQDQSCIPQEPVEKRIAKTLLNMNLKHGQVLNITKRQIAEMSATTVETAIRTMSKFQKNKWIHSTRGKISVDYPEALKALLD